MFKKISAIIALVIILALAGCKKEENMKAISQVSIVTEAGSILPELRWHEAYIITTDTVTFKRSGFVDTSEVNAGSWEIPADAQKISSLFLVLETVNLKSIVRVEPVDLPEGGGSKFYQFTYADGKTWSLDYTPGVTYKNGDSITKPLQAFIDTLQLPIEAVNQYRY